MAKKEKRELTDFEKAFRKQWRAKAPDLDKRMELSPDVYKREISKFKILSDIHAFRKRFVKVEPVAQHKKHKGGL